MACVEEMSTVATVRSPEPKRIRLLRQREDDSIQLF